MGHCAQALFRNQFTRDAVDAIHVAPNDGTEVEFDDFKLNIKITKS